MDVKDGCRQTVLSVYDDKLLYSVACAANFIIHLSNADIGRYRSWPVGVF